MTIVEPPLPFKTAHALFSRCLALRRGEQPWAVGRVKLSNSVLGWVWPPPTWRIIPVRITPVYKPFRPFGRGPTTRSLGDLRSPWLLTT